MVFPNGPATKMMFDHAHTPPPRPSSRVELPFPADLEKLIMECLEKDPALRPRDAQELSRRLDACKTASPWTPERAERWWSAHAPGVAKARPFADILLSREASRALGV
jgi:eukaryotic-like serine/threonine-protein kinase